MQLVGKGGQHACPRDIHGGSGREVADDPRQRSCELAALFANAGTDVVDVEIEQRGLRAQHERVRHGFVLWMALSV
ncbi:hypothetical protein D3C87_1522200 [compost metagenome]